MDWNNKVSDNVRNVPFSGIRKFFDLASTMKDVISLGVGEPDYSARTRSSMHVLKASNAKKPPTPPTGGLLSFEQK